MDTRKKLQRYDIDIATGCWNWTGFVSKQGYGKAYSPMRRRVTPAHRAIYESAHGLVDMSLDLDHLCRNRRCVNPAHLEPVTRFENLIRGANTKLTWEVVRDIRARYAAGGITHRELSRDYGISNRQSSQVVLGRSWKDSSYARPVRYQVLHVRGELSGYGFTPPPIPE